MPSLLLEFLLRNLLLLMVLLREVMSHSVLVCISLMISNVEHFFHIPIGCLYVFNSLFRLLSIFKADYYYFITQLLEFPVYSEY
jgi:hypothetical protein